MKEIDRHKAALIREVTHAFALPPDCLDRPGNPRVPLKFE